ncbi:hypothetical protein EUTSA_v10018339mg [Eutrema salsugineum]|uniref:PUM-HD domain-containing protein n=2 Tax=Eutrema salsugineum TaxID=72664 RepID=V4KC37_EUTSA|nr:hypothetical protein EUTSA_v10018339mg [Eutrema salsugineum]
MDEFREASSSPLRTPSHSPNLNLVRQNMFHGDYSPNSNRFSFNSSSEYSLSSSFSNGFCSSEDSSSPFASPPLSETIPKNNHASPVAAYHHHPHDSLLFHDKSDDLGLCEDLYRMKIKQDVEEDARSESLGYEQSNNGFVVDGGFFLTPKEDKRSMFWNQVPDSLANSRQIGWPSYSSSNGGYINGHDILGSGLNREGISAMSPFFCQGAQAPFSSSASKGSELFSSEESLFMELGLDHQSQRSNGHGSNTEMCLPNMCDIQGYVYLMAKDQHGCRFLQRVFDQGTPLDAMIIFNQVIAHVVELMMDPFGNYLMQKLLDVCNEEQRTQIVLVATAEPGQLIRISLNAYGTRVVQRLVETLRTGKQISLVKSALRPGFLDLIKDLNGNHVIQRCLQCLSTEDNKFIFDAATKFCTEIATHRHGCCVLQKCIAYSMRQQREKLIAEISRNSLLLAQDPFGNYAVQFVIELRIPSAVAMMLTQLKGHYVQLSMQKFSSHMVERCLMHCPESRPQIVRELVSVPHFDQLLQDPYANFVIQAALAVTKGPLHASLVEVIRPHSILRNNPYCKRIFSRNLLKK